MPEDYGKYRLEELIARGGMAEVYRGSTLGAAGFSKQVCIKRIRPEHGDDPEFAVMFEREAQIAASLQHPNIVQVFDFDRHNGELFIAMEYVDGTDLRHVLKVVHGLELRLPLGFALHVTHGILSALKHAQEIVVDGAPLAVVHRDVSPHNLLLSVEGFVKLADFGIAKARGSVSATRTGVLKGKLAYISPEQANCEDVGATSDLFCVGLVLFEMLCGRRLLVGQSDQELLARALAPVVPPMPGFSGELDAFVRKLLAVKPDDRFESASVALDALENLNIARQSNLDAGKLISAVMEIASSTEDARPFTPSAASDQDQSVGRSYRDASSSNKVSLTNALTKTSLQNIPHVSQFVSHSRSSVWGRVLNLRILAPIILAIIIAGVWLIWGGRGEVAATVVPLMPPSQTVASPAPAAEPVKADELPKKQESLVEMVEPDKAERQASLEHQAPVEVAEPTTLYGSLKINCRPWAQVKIDGRKSGTTPVHKKRLPVGKHRIVLTNDPLGFKKVLNVKIRPGRTTTVKEEIGGAR